MSPEQGGGPVPPQRVTTPRPRRGAPPLHHVGLVAAGGAVGALARVGLAHWLPVTGEVYPWTTFAENVSGSFALALALTLLAERFTTHRWVLLLVCTGALGAFTTYSTFATELTGRVLDGSLLLAGTYAAASLMCGLAAALVGIRAARAWPWLPQLARRRAQ